MNQKKSKLVRRVGSMLGLSRKEVRRFRKEWTRVSAGTRGEDAAVMQKDIESWLAQKR